MSTPTHRAPESQVTAVLRAMGVGGFFGFLIVALFAWELWYVLAALVVFFGTAAANAVYVGVTRRG